MDNFVKMQRSMRAARCETSVDRYELVVGFGGGLGSRLRLAWGWG